MATSTKTIFKYLYNMHEIGDKIKIINHKGTYQIVANKDHPKQIGYNTIPPKDMDYALKRIDGYMTSKFENYIYILESMIERENR